MKGERRMQILDDGHIVYGIDEVPLPLIFKDLSYQIISSKDNKKLLPVLRIALSKDVKFLLGNCLIDPLGENDITYYIDDGLQLLIDTVCLKFIKHIKVNARGGDPRRADASSYWLEVFSHKDEDKILFYTPHCDDDEDDEIFENKFLAESFLYEVVEPSTKYLLDKYCDKHYEIVVSEIKDMVYDTSNIQADKMTDDEILKALKDEGCSIVKSTIVHRNLKGYSKREKQNDPDENNEPVEEGTSEKQDASGEDKESLK
jgi:hypothetical protein